MAVSDHGASVIVEAINLLHDDRAILAPAGSPWQALCLLGGVEGRVGR